MALPPDATVDYYSRLAERDGGLAKTLDWPRLFMIPSAWHCTIGGGELSDFDSFDEMVQWVEHDQAPDRIVAVGRENPDDNTSPILRSRPVFPYPLVAKYDGSGSIDDDSNFVPGRPLVNPKNDQIDWIGEFLHRVPGPVAR